MEKDKKWLKEQIERLSYTPKGLDENSSIISKNWALNFIDQLDEQEKPVIPQFIADWIERQKQYGNEPVFISMKRLINQAPQNVVNWFNNNLDLYARAWLDGYEVDREKLYRIELIKGKYLIYNNENKQIHNQDIDTYISDHEQREFTEIEIKAIDSRYLIFKKEVEI